MGFFINQIGANSVTVGGIKMLSDFSVELVVVDVDGAVVKIEGERLLIDRFDENEIKVTGIISNISTQQKNIKGQK